MSTSVSTATISSLNYDPVVQDLIYNDDEDGLTSVAPNDSLVANKLVFEMKGSDADGDALTYKIKTGTFTSDAQTYTIAATSVVGTYSILHNSQIFTLKDLGDGKFELSTSEFQYLNAGQIRTLKFQYEASAGFETETKTVSFANALTGVAGNQTWGDLKLSAYTWDGVATTAVIDSARGLGILGGRFNYEIDLKNGTTSQSEKLVIEFPKTVDKVGLTLSYFFPNEQSKYFEVAVWKAYDSNGNLLEQGALNAGDGVKVGNPSSYKYGIDFISDKVVKIELTAAPYSNNVIQGGGGDNSDYGILAVEYSTIEESVSNAATATVNIYGTKDNVAPIALDVIYQDDEDGSNLVSPNNTLVNNKLVFSLNATDGNADALTYAIKTGAYTISGQSYTVASTSTAGTFKVTNNGKTFTIKDIGGGKFELLTSEFQYLDSGESRTISFKYLANDGTINSNEANVTVTIFGTNDEPVARDVSVQDDEDALNSVNPNGTLTATKLIFGFSATDVDGETLTYSIKTGTFTNGGQTYTIASTSTAGAYTLTNNGQTFTLKDVGDGKFELLTSEFQYLNDGQTRTISFQYTANDGSVNSNTATTTVTIHGTNDGSCPVAQDICVQDDEDGKTTVVPNDSLVANKLVFEMKGSDADGDALTYKIKTGTFTSDGQTFTIASTSTAGTYTLTNNGQTFTLKDIGGGKFELLTSEFQYLNSGDIRTLKFQYEASGGLDVETKAVNVSNALTGLAGNQTWGDLKLSAYSWDGNLVLATLGSKGVGVAGGRFNTEIDYKNGSTTGESEKLVIEFPKVISSAALTLNYFYTGEQGNYEVAVWKAFDASGNLVQQGTLKAGEGANLGSGSYLYNISFSSNIAKLELSTAPYSGTVTTGNNGDNSDYALGAIEYTSSEVCISDAATATVKIHGTNDLSVRNQVFIEDEDAIDGTSASAGGFTDQDSGNPTGQLKFTLNNYTYVGSGTLTFSGIPASVVVDGKTYNITNNGNGTFTLDKSQFQHLGVGEKAEFTFNYTVSDGSLSATAQAKVVVIGTNDGPDAVDDNLGTINAGSSTTINILTNDTDPDGDDLDISSINSVVINGVTIPSSQWNNYITRDNETGQFNFNSSPMNVPAGTSQNVVINYTATDNNGGTDSANIFVTVRGEDVSLTAGNEQFVDDEDAIDGTAATSGAFTDLDDGNPAGSLRFNIDNISYNGSAPLTYTVPASVTIAGKTYNITNNGNGTFTLDKSQFQSLDTGERVELTFNYTVSNGTLSATAQAKVVVIGTNDAPTLINMTVSDDEDGNESFTPSDTVVANKLVFNFTGGSDVDVETLTYQIKTGTFTSGGQNYLVAATATAGVFTITNNSQTFTLKDIGGGQFEMLTSEFQYLKVGETRTLKFEYVANDGSVDSNKAVATVNIVGTNDGPDAVDDNAGTINDGDSVTLNILANDTDPDGDDLDISSINSVVINGVTIPSSQWNNYITRDNETGQFNFNSSPMNVPAGTSQNVVINYTATDNNGGTDSANVFVTVRGENLNLVASNQQFVDDEDAIDGTAATSGAFTDLDDGNPAGSLRFTINNYTYNGSDPVTISGVPASITVGGKTYNITNNGNGIFTLDKSQFQSLDTGGRVELSFNYTVTAGSISSSAQAKIVVIGTNDAPMVVDISRADDEDGLTSVTPNDSVVANKLIFNFSGATDVDVETLTYQVKAGTFTSGGQNYVVAATATAGVFTITNNSQTFTLKDIGGGQFEMLTSEFQYLDAGETRVLRFQFQANDGTALSNNGVATITIHGTNDLATSNQIFVEDEDAIDGAAATAGGFTDLDDGNPAGSLRFTINNFNYDGSGTPTITGIPASVVVDGKTYNITNNGNGAFTLDKSQFQHLSVGEKVEFTFNYTVSDGVISSTSQAKVVIIGTNDGPDAVDDNAGTINDGDSVTLNILANDTDPDGDDLDVSSINSLVINGTTINSANYSQYFTINSETGQLVFNSANINVLPGTSQNVVINYTATDNNGGTDSANVFVTVRGEDLNLIASNQQFVDDEDAIDASGLSGVVSSVSYNDLDNGNAASNLQFTINNYTFNGSSAVSFSGVPATIVGSDGKIYNITNNGNGTFTLDKSQFQHIPVGAAVALAFTYTISANSLTSSAQAKVIIIGANDAPDAVNDNIGTITEGTTKLIDVLPNDSDPDGDAINVTRITKIVIDGVEYTNPTDIDNFVTLLPNNKLFLDTSSINKSTDYNIVITYEISDPYGAKDTADVFVNVDNVDKVIYYGDAQNDSLIVTTANAVGNNTATITSDVISGVTKNYLNNTVVLNDAEAYGDLKNLTLKATAGNATATASAFSTGGTEFGFAQSDAAISNNIFNFGDDNVQVNRGEIVGDVAKLLLEGVQGNASANFALDCFNPFAKATANVDVNNNTFNFGDDILKAIDANIYGDVKNLEFKYTNGTTSGNGTLQDDDNWNFGNKFHFGNDVITLQKGLLVGDISSVTVNGTTYDLSVASQLAAFKATTAYTANTFNFGTDTFVFDVSTPADATIADFGINGVTDKLSIKGMIDVNGGGLSISDLTDVSSIINESGHISLIINLAGVESSISFLNITFDAAKLEITDYLNSSDILLSA